MSGSAPVVKKLPYIHPWWVTAWREGMPHFRGAEDEPMDEEKELKRAKARAYQQAYRAGFRRRKQTTKGDNS